MSSRVSFADPACTVCLTPFAELIDQHKITFASCQHTMCLPCLTTHMNSKMESATQTPCCKQPLNLTLREACLSAPPTFYKFKLTNVMGDRLFRAEPHYQYHGNVLLRSLNDNMLKFNEVAEYREEDGFAQLDVSAGWKQVYFQLPGHEDEHDADESTMHLVLLRVKDGHLEFAWTDPRISIARVDLQGSARLLL